jgi:hypothetical protein
MLDEHEAGRDAEQDAGRVPGQRAEPEAPEEARTRA